MMVYFKVKSSPHYQYQMDYFAIFKIHIIALDHPLKMDYFMFDN